MSLTTAVLDLVDALNTAGIPASADPGELNLPGVWVQLAAVSENLLSGGLTVTLRLFLITGDTGAVDALDSLSTLYRQVLTIITPNTDTDTTTVSVQLPDNPSTPLPALSLTVDTLESLH